jgi:hypothetical protein
MERFNALQTSSSTSEISMSNPNKRRRISEEILAPLREQVREAFRAAKHHALDAPNNRASLDYEELGEAIFEATGRYAPSAGTLHKVFHNHTNFKYESRTIETLERFVEAHVPRAPHSDAGNQPTGTETRELKYYRERLHFEDIAGSSRSFGSLTDRDIDILKRLGALEISEIRWDLVERRLIRNPDILRGFRVVPPLGEPLVVGFFVLYPITRQCQLRIEAGAISKSDEFGAEDVCEDLKDATAMYISWVFAVRELDRVLLLRKLRSELHSMVTNCENLQVFFVRPVTPHDEVRWRGFSRLGESPLYSLKLSEVKSENWLGE